jgi:hypothetical protein
MRNNIKVYSKNPDVVLITKWDGGNAQDILDFIGVTGSSGENYASYSDTKGLVIHFAGGSNAAKVGEYIVKKHNGSFFSCSYDVLGRVYGYEPIDKVIDSLKKY